MSDQVLDRVIDTDDRPETVAVLRSVHATAFHRLHPNSDEPRPLCECQSHHRSGWTEWDIDQAEAWREPCQECFPDG